jgi:RNA polymerase-binding transcription factor DksA
MFIDKTTVKVRVFDGKAYLTNQKEYKSKLDAKAVVLFLKTKAISVRARIIEKKDSFVIYFDQATFYEISYGTIKIPDVSEVPDDIKETIRSHFNEIPDEVKITLEKDKPQKDQEINVIEKPKDNKNWRDLQQDKFKDKHDGSFEVVRLDKDVSTTDLLNQSEKNTSDTPKDEEEQGINAVLNHVENEFFKSCKKCGGDMKPTFLLVGKTTRLSIFQCSSCKFYIPRRM